MAGCFSLQLFQLKQFIQASTNMDFLLNCNKTDSFLAIYVTYINHVYKIRHNCFEPKQI